MYSSAKFFVPMMMVGDAVVVACAGRVNAAAKTPMTIATPKADRECRLRRAPSVLADHSYSFREGTTPRLVRRSPLGVTATCRPVSPRYTAADSAITQIEAPRTPDSR